MDRVEHAFLEHIRVAQATLEGLASKAASAGDRIATTFRQGGKVLLFGNGGSAADALHMEGEFLGRFLLNREGLPAIALGGGISSITATANDYEYDNAFARFARAHLKEGDTVVLISTSGDSPNIIEAAKASADRGTFRIGFTGRSGGKLAAHVDLLLNVPSDDTPRIQEMHGLLGHVLCDRVEQALFGGIQGM